MPVPGSIPDVDHSVRLEADPTGGDVVFSLDMRAPRAGGGYIGMRMGDVTTIPLGAVLIERARDASGRVRRVNLVLDLVKLPDFPS